MLHLGRHHSHEAPAESIHDGLDVVISKKRHCCSTSFAACWPISTSCAGVYCCGGMMRVCATAARQRKTRRRRQKAGVGTLSVSHCQQASL